MARPPRLAGRRKRRHVLRYDRSRDGRLLETRVDITLAENAIPTPISPLYQLRLVPSFQVPARPNDLTLRQLQICTTDNGTRTVFVPYLPSDLNHNLMLIEYLSIIPSPEYEGILYIGEAFNS